MKNKLPRKRKKAMIKATNRLNYLAAQVMNGLAPARRPRFPKLEFNNNRNRVVTVGYW